MIRRGFLLAIAGSVLVSVMALAGPNAGGTIFVHDSNYVIQSDLPTFCGEGAPPPSCEGADVNLEGSSDATQKLWKMYAAFPGSPRLKGMTFGVHYDVQNVVISIRGPCVGDMNNGGAELPGPGWPGNDTGTTIVFQDTQTTELVECYFFAGYNYYGTPSIFQLRDNPDPVLGGVFADDSVPSIQDNIAGYGSMGFDMPGQTACPALPNLGACCFCDSHCEELEDPDCIARGGVWYEGIPCDPNPCPNTGPGACCYPDGHCEYVCEWECPTGVWSDVPCDPNLCEQPNPTRTSTWGGIKAIYRDSPR